MKKKIQKDRNLPLKRAITGKVYRRKDSSLWQARFVAPDGKLKRKSTGTRNRNAAGECLLLLKREAQRKSQFPPPRKRAPESAQLTLPLPTFSNPNTTKTT